MSPTLIYIGASTLQLPALQWAKDQGLRVIVTDTNTNAPGIALADGYKNIAGDDVRAQLNLARDIQAQDRLVGAYCGSDFGLPAVAAIAEAFDLPGPTVQCVQVSLDKNKALQVMRQSGVRVPQGICVTSQAELDEAVASLGFPVIVKPVDSSGSRGVKTVLSRDQLDDAFGGAQTFSHQVLVEKIVEGHHVDVNGLFVDGVFYPCGLLSRFFSPPPYHYPIWGCEPCLLDELTCTHVYETVEAGARALGIISGPVKGDVIVSTGQAVVLEISARFHGDVSTSFVTPLACSKSAPNAWFAHLAGKPFEDELPKDNRKDNLGRVAGWMGIFPNQLGVFEALIGIDEALAVPGVAQIRGLKQPGYRVSAIADNLAVMGFIWATGDDEKSLQRTLHQARAMISVKMTN